MSTLTHTRDLEQRLTALEHANEVRSARAVLKRELKAGRRSICSVLICPPDFCETMKVSALLAAVPKLGRVKVKRLMLDAGVGAYRTVGQLTDRQRLALVALFDRRLPTEEAGR